MFHLFSTSKPCVKLYMTYESILKIMTSTPNRCCINIFCYNDITFVILKSANSADILYTIHVSIDAIIFVKCVIFLICTHHLSLFFLRYIIYTWVSQEDGVQPCDCPTI